MNNVEAKPEPLMFRSETVHLERSYVAGSGEEPSTGVSLFSGQRCGPSGGSRATNRWLLSARAGRTYSNGLPKIAVSG